MPTARSPRLLLVVTTDGRGEYLSRTVTSVAANLPGDWVARVMVDDSGDADYGARLRGAYPDWSHVRHLSRRGFAATVRSAWRAAVLVDADYLFHLEDDFVFPAPVDVGELERLLIANPHLAQVALKRQPVNAAEEAAGGFMGQHPEDWEQRDGYAQTTLFFSTNPSLVPRRTIDLALACDAPLSEPNLTVLLLAYGMRFGWLGRLEDPPRVEHIGTRRAPGWSE